MAEERATRKPFESWTLRERAFGELGMAAELPGDAA
jgi:hypothetical protein